jgi:hypothetical protein
MKQIEGLLFFLCFCLFLTFLFILHVYPNGFILHDGAAGSQ